jgi:hypothetical protein
MSQTSSLQEIINDNLQLDRLMEEIDNQLREDGVPIEARPLMAGLMISRRFNCSFSLDSPVGMAINTWFNERYGDRLKIDFKLGETVILIKGDPYKVGFPIAIGINGEVNVLEWIKAATPALLYSLDEKELDDLAEVIIELYEMFNNINSLSLPRELTVDLDIAVYCLMLPIPECGLSKWSSLQAAEKTIKGFIRLKGETPQKTHILNTLLNQAELLGLPKLDSSTVNNVQCKPDVRYDKPVELSDAVNAYHSAVKICHHVALHYK